MIIIIIGDEDHSRYSVQFDDKLITLNGCDYLALLSLATAWVDNKNNCLGKDYLFDELTARYIYRLKKHISKLAEFDASDLIINQYRNGSRKAGCYKLNVDDIIIEKPAYKFDDHRIVKVLEKYAKKVECS